MYPELAMWTTEELTDYIHELMNEPELEGFDEIIERMRDEIRFRTC